MESSERVIAWRRLCDRLAAVGPGILSSSPQHLRDYLIREFGREQERMRSELREMVAVGDGVDLDSERWDGLS